MDLIKERIKNIFSGDEKQPEPEPLNYIKAEQPVENEEITPFTHAQKTDLRFRFLNNIKFKQTQSIAAEVLKDIQTFNYRLLRCIKTAITKQEMFKRQLRDEEMDGLRRLCRRRIFYNRAEQEFQEKHRIIEAVCDLYSIVALERIEEEKASTDKNTLKALSSLAEEINEYRYSNPSITFEAWQKHKRDLQDTLEVATQAIMGGEVSGC